MFKREDGTSRVEYLTYYIQDNSTTSHRVSHVSITMQGPGKSPKRRVLYDKAGRSVTVYDVGSATTVYTAGKKVEYYTVGFTGTVLYEAGTQKTYYTKS